MYWLAADTVMLSYITGYVALRSARRALLNNHRKVCRVTSFVEKFKSE